MSNLLWTVFTDLLPKAIFNLPSYLLYYIHYSSIHKNADLTDKFGAKLGKYLVIHFKQIFHFPKASEIVYKYSCPYFLFTIIFQTW